jgi:hypothetical protein
LAAFLSGSTPSRAADAASAARWPRVYVRNAAIAFALRDALSGASQRLEDPRCGSIFSAPDFHDGSGQPLTEKLVALRMSGPDYLDVVVFLDGTGERRCQEGALAFTQPGARTVYVCGRRFWRAWNESPRHAQAVLIHEALHTLGLGEDPPSSAAITQAVRAHCYR